MTPAAVYGRDLAYAHDTGFGDFARGAAPGLLRLLRRSGIEGGLVVDLGCVEPRVLPGYGAAVQFGRGHVGFAALERG